MESILLLDTDVLIDYLRNRAEAVSYLENITQAPIVSAVTVAELFAGVREGEERKILNELIKNSSVIPITEEIAISGGLYRRDYHKSHGIGLADAIIAATAEAENATLVTLNKKHFPMLRKLFVPYRKS